MRPTQLLNAYRLFIILYIFDKLCAYLLKELNYKYKLKNKFEYRYNTIVKYKFNLCTKV